MEIDSLLGTVTDMSDLELAVLLSLVAKQHCLITTEDTLMEDLAAELALIVSDIFTLSYTVLSLDAQQSVEEFGAAILNDDPSSDFEAVDDHNDMSHVRSSRSASINMRTDSCASASDLDRRMVVNVIIAKNFDLAHRDVQIATLELIQKRRIFSRTTVHPVPKTFLFIPLLATGTKGQRLNHHLNDRIAMSHHHTAQDGFANLEELDQRATIEQQSLSSLDNHSITSDTDRRYSITYEMIDQIRKLGNAVKMTPEIRRYIQDLVVFLRMERGVDGGISPFATTMCVEISRHLAALHGIDYVTPSLVALTVRKIYSHRIVLASPKRERSVQWGSDIEAVKDVLHNLTAETIINNVLSGVQCPV